MKDKLNLNAVRPIITLALNEDIGRGDITTNAIFQNDSISEAVIIAKEEGIFCGGAVAGFIYSEIDPGIKITILKKDGKAAAKEEKLLKLKGSTKSLLTGERTCLNFLQRMSGIATKTAKIAGVLKKIGITVLDTRKTAPGMRLLDKYSVKCGGGKNHRTGLFDMILIKDNHIKAAGGITKAVERVVQAYGKKFVIEVEATTLEEVSEAVTTKANIIMLDNMQRDEMLSAVKMIKGRKKIEVSGNFDEERLFVLSGLKVDYVSIGALTHSVKAFDLSMRFV